jgi:hypothetical protein
MTDDAPQLRGELRRLSSAATEPFKVVGLVFATLSTLVALGSLFLRDWLPILCLFAVSAVVWMRAWIGLRLSVVQTDGHWLLASSLSRTAWIPLTKVLSVSRVWFPGAQRIYVEVGADTPFGREIVFQPPLDPGALVGRHPVVEELRALVARAKAAHSRARSCAS